MPNITATLAPEAGPLGAPWPPLDFATGAAFTGAAGAATCFGGGGGQVMLPSLMTVRPRMASSSMLTLMVPSVVLVPSSALHSSSVRRSRLVAYSVLACFGRRLGRSV